MSKKGGYCKIKKDDVFNKRYTAVKKLGHGRFSNCWEVIDGTLDESVQKLQNNNAFALKVQKSKKEYTETAEDEIKIFESLESMEYEDNVVKLINNFKHDDKTGTHVCMVLDKMDMNLLDLLEKKHEYGMPIPLVKEIIRQILQGLQFLKNNEVIHTDMKPENILLKVENSTIVVKIGDLGNACWTYKHFTDQIGTTEYRSPEAIINADYDCATDVWALACITFELLTGDYLFDPHSRVNEIEVENFDDSDSDDDSDDSDDESDSDEDDSDNDSDYESDKDSDSDSDDDDSDENDEHLVDQMQIWLMHNMLGNMPKYIQRKGEVSKDFFHRAGNIRKNPSFLKERSVGQILSREYNFDDEDSKKVEDFLMPMLRYDTDKRATPEQMLKHDWLQ